jgi:Kef-type K+ transport system membrane component KefB
MNSEQLLLAVAVILLVARGLGWAVQRIGQPRVVGEMIAGIVLGPSLFGRLFPGAFGYVFPSSTLPGITVLSQLGLLLFMFVVGVEVNIGRMLRQSTAVVLVSNVSILLPLGMGVALATTLFPRFAGQGVGFPVFGLFMGTAMSITAFPVLARILKERNLLGTDLGTVAISCAAIDDISAWLLLAVLTAMVHSAQNWRHLAITLLSLVVFVAVMMFPVRRAANLLESLHRRYGAGVEFVSALVLIMLLASWVTERLGVHALFGAFMAGLVMPKNERITTDIIDRFESLSLGLLLPLFFALTGLRTRIDMLGGASMLGFTAAIILTAVVGKLAGAALTARATGMRWRDSLGLGVLMNTRGLVELVILNAGLDLGILSPPLFTMMVLMALITTFMTTPILIAMKVNSNRS